MGVRDGLGRAEREEGGREEGGRDEGVREEGVREEGVREEGAREGGGGCTAVGRRLAGADALICSEATMSAFRLSRQSLSESIVTNSFRRLS